MQFYVRFIVTAFSVREKSQFPFRFILCNPILEGDLIADAKFLANIIQAPFTTAISLNRLQFQFRRICLKFFIAYKRGFAYCLVLFDPILQHRCILNIKFLTDCLHALPTFVICMYRLEF